MCRMTSGVVRAAVDEDLVALGDVERTLRDRLHWDYSVVCLRSSGEALSYLEERATADGPSRWFWRRSGLRG